MAFVIAFSGIVALAQGGDSPAELELAALPPWRDLPRAQQELTQAIEARDAVNAAIASTLRNLEAETARLSLMTTDEATVDLLTAEIQELAVHRYISGGTDENWTFFLEVSEVTDSLWREGLVSEVSELVDEAIEHLDLIPEARASTEARIERINTTISQLYTSRATAEQNVSDAAWAVEIAEINAFADAELIRTGRTEPTPQQWHNLRHCESRNDYTAVSPANYFGAYQFGVITWSTVGGSGNPAAASPEEQDARARVLFAQRGSQPWPREHCGRWLPLS